MVPLATSKRDCTVERDLASIDFGHPLTKAQVGKHIDIPSFTVSQNLQGMSQVSYFLPLPMSPR
jgi:hypothetical protein